MGRRKWHVLPCGAMYAFIEYGYSDITSTTWEEFLSLPKEQRRLLYNPDNVGRKRQLWATRTATIFTRKLVSKIMRELIKGNRVVLRRFSRFNGNLPVTLRLVLGPGLSYRANWETDGMVPHILLEGLQHNYYFRIRSDRKREIYHLVHTGHLVLPVIKDL